MLSVRSLTRVVALEALETFLPGKEPSLGLLALSGGGQGAEGDVLKEMGEPPLLLGSNEPGPDADSRLRPGMTRPVVNCDWSRSLMYELIVMALSSGLSGIWRP